MITLKALCSGGQTGADLGSLLAAEEVGIYTFGWAPKDFRTEAGRAEWLSSRFNLMEHASEDYPPRTKANVLASDGTIVFGVRSVGSNLTEEECRKAGKPCAWVFRPRVGHEKEDTISIGKSHATIYRANNVAGIRLWLRDNNINIVNGAGNRESKNPGICEFVKDFLIQALQ